MAIPRQNDPDLDALLHKGAAEITRLNPHIAAPTSSYTDEECAAILHDDDEIERLWDSPEGRQARQADYSAADAVDEDRGE
ncbi:MAG TPA: hypothetical protein VFY89_03930 [Ktedonobacterales bacterium]